MGIQENVTLPETLIIPEGITAIQDSSFTEYCGGDFSIVLPSSLEYIGEGAFCDCSSLVSITLNSGLLDIGALAFAGTSITSLVIPASVTTIGSCIIEGCASLTKVYIAHDDIAVLENIEELAFYNEGTSFYFKDSEGNVRGTLGDISSYCPLGDISYGITEEQWENIIGE